MRLLRRSRYLCLSLSSSLTGSSSWIEIAKGKFFLTGLRIFSVLTTTSISPVPGMYKNKRRTASGGKLTGRTARADASTMAPTMDPGGDKRGWSTLCGEDPDAEEPIENLEDLADKRLRECIRLILLGFGE